MMASPMIVEEGDNGNEGGDIESGRSEHASSAGNGS
jgi:hypothetical protein